MTKKKKKLLGVGAFLPIILIPVVMILIFAAALLAEIGLEPISGLLMVLMFISYLVAIVGMLATWIYFIVDTFRNPNVKKDNQVVWVLALVFGGAFASPFYWYINIWKGYFPEQEYDTNQFRPRELNQTRDKTQRVDDFHNFDNRRVPEPMSWRDDD